MVNKKIIEEIEKEIKKYDDCKQNGHDTLFIIKQLIKLKNNKKNF